MSDEESGTTQMSEDEESDEESGSTQMSEDEVSDEEGGSTQMGEDKEFDEECGATQMSKDEEGGGEETNQADSVEEIAALLFPRGNVSAERLRKVSERIREQPRIDLSRAREALKELEPTKLLGETSQSSIQHGEPVKPKDVDFISTEFEITRKRAEKVLREHNGDVYKAAVALLKAD